QGARAAEAGSWGRRHPERPSAPPIPCDIMSSPPLGNPCPEIRVGQKDRRAFIAAIGKVLRGSMGLTHDAPRTILPIPGRSRKAKPIGSPKPSCRNGLCLASPSLPEALPPAWLEEIAQGGGQLARRLVALEGILGHRLEADGLERGRDGTDDPAGRGRRLLEDLRHQVCQARAAERWL